MPSSTAPSPATVRLGRFNTARRVLALALPYFRSDERWRARALLAAIVVLNLASVYMLVLLNEWNRTFYDALQNRQQDVFWQQLLRFCWIALGFIVISVYKFYLTQLLELRWRAWMTRDTLARWLAHHTFYRLELARYSAAAAGATAAGATADNPDQRIQEDLNLFTAFTVTLSMGLLNAVVTLASFIGILWGLSGAFGFSWGGSSYSIPGFMVWMALAYCVAGSVAAHFIGRRLVPLNFQQQKKEADFRHHLVRVREFSESIALDRGAATEKVRLDLRFTAVLGNALQLIRAQKRLTWFTSGFGQAAIVFPFIVAAPRYFGGAIQLGELMQVISAFGRVQDALSWFVDNYDNLASWRATTDRLTGFEASMAQQASAPVRITPLQAEGIAARDLALTLPDGTALLAPTTLAVGAGDSVLLEGPSGSGKSTLFRALAGIWPHAAGGVALPPGAMFLPQRPYLPDGPLRAALAYPDAADRHDDAALRQALADALLPQLADRLDDEDAWSQKLSGGEQQRLAIARVLLKRPRWLLADEATSALDPAAEAQLYERLRALTAGAGGALVSIAHRPAVAAFHDRRWTLVPNATAAGRPRFALESR